MGTFEVSAAAESSPFEVTKAVEFTDAEINQNWVELPGGGFRRVIEPISPVPMILLGGKGSGRTHLMRYCSYPVQKLRIHDGALLEGLRDEGFLGLFLRCEGLNAGRFQGKGQPADKWAALFSYYMDLWLAELALLTLIDIAEVEPTLLESEREIVRDVIGLFDAAPDVPTLTLSCLRTSVRDLLRQLDLAINNAALTRELPPLDIRVSPSRLVFGIPRIFSERVAGLTNVRFLYLIDELENLTLDQQRYVNTLVREKTPPATLRVGSRLYGYRTRETYSAGEQNLPGSEYDEVILDEHLRGAQSGYDTFAQALVVQRLRRAGIAVPSGEIGEDVAEFLESLFVTPKRSRFEESQTQFVIRRFPNAEERPYFTRLREKLLRYSDSWASPALDAQAAADFIIRQLVMPTIPLLERANVFLLYRAWARGEDMVLASESIGTAARSFGAGASSRMHERVWAHYKSDVLAQLYRDCRRPLRYCGIGTFIDISAGIARNLLTVLKFVDRWARFYGELPFTGVPISVRAQRAGVLQAADWFLRDASASSDRGETVYAAVDRLARFMRALRYSDKPVESSLTTFSFGDASRRALDAVDRAYGVSLILRIRGGQRHRNEESVVPKYQLNPLLAPRYGLGTSRRGAVHLTPAEMDAIFGTADEEGFKRVVSERLLRQMAPFKTQRAHEARSAETLLDEQLFLDFE